MLVVSLYGLAQAYQAFYKEPSWLNLLFIALAKIDVKLSMLGVVYAFEGLSLAIKNASKATKFIKVKKPLPSKNTAPSGQIKTTSKATEIVEERERVGRWMSRNEYDKMVATGYVQEGAGGVTYVARPANISAYSKQAKVGSLYVEFNVPFVFIKKYTRGMGKNNWT